MHRILAMPVAVRPAEQASFAPNPCASGDTSVTVVRAATVSHGDGRSSGSRDGFTCQLTTCQLTTCQPTGNLPADNQVSAYRLLSADLSRAGVACGGHCRLTLLCARQVGDLRPSGCELIIGRWGREVHAA